MSATLRPYVPTDRDAVQELRLAAYPDYPEAKEAPWYDALYEWLAADPLASDAHRWVVDDGSRIVAHLYAVPQAYLIGGRRVITHTPADYMARPGSGFAAIRLMKAFFAECPHFVGCDWNPDVTKIETAMGCVPVADLEYEIKPLNVGRRTTANGMTALPGRAAAFALRSMDRGLGAAFGGDLRATEEDGFDDGFDAFFETIARSVPAIPEKNATYLRWRYGQSSPQTATAIFVVRDGATLLGYAVVRSPENRDGYILDLMTLRGRDDVQRALLRGAIGHSWHRGSYALRYRYLGSRSSVGRGLLRQLGFTSRKLRRYPLIGKRQTARYTFLVRFTDDALQQVAVNAADWSYGFGDGEASFWIR